MHYTHLTDWRYTRRFASAPSGGTDDWLSGLSREEGSPSILSPPPPQPSTPASARSPPPAAAASGASPVPSVHAPAPRSALSIAPVLSPPASVVPSPQPPSAVAPPADTAELDTLRAQVQSGQQTISLLVAEKSSLSAALENLSGAQNREYQVLHRARNR